MYLLDTLDAKCSGLVDQLFSVEVISPVERDDINAEKTSFRANEKLLSVLSYKSAQQYQQFLDALDNCDQRHVADVVRGVKQKKAPDKCGPRNVLDVTKELPGAKQKHALHKCEHQPVLGVTKERPGLKRKHFHERSNKKR